MSEFLGPENEKLENVENLEGVLDSKSTQAMGELAVGQSPEENESRKDEELLEHLERVFEKEAGGELGNELAKSVCQLMEDYDLSDYEESLLEIDYSDDIRGALYGILLNEGYDPDILLPKYGITEKKVDED